MVLDTGIVFHSPTEKKINLAFRDLSVQSHQSPDPGKWGLPSAHSFPGWGQHWDTTHSEAKSHKKNPQLQENKKQNPTASISSTLSASFTGYSCGNESGMRGKASLCFKDTTTVWRSMSISKYVCNWRTNPKGEVKSLSLHRASALSKVMKYACAYLLSWPQLPQRLWTRGGRRVRRRFWVSYERYAWDVGKDVNILVRAVWVTRAITKYVCMRVWLLECDHVNETSWWVYLWGCVQQLYCVTR